MNISFILAYIAAILTSPLIWAHQAFVRLVMPLKAGKYGQLKNRWLEVGYRLLLFVPAALISVMGIVSSTFGISIRKISCCLNKQSYHYFLGRCKEKTASRQIFLFSLNVCFLSGGFPLVIAGILPWRKRIKKIVALIVKNNPELLCLQEVYDIQAAYFLYRKLKSKYAYFYLNIGPHPRIGANSGLFVASKLKIDNPGFASFKYNTFVNKGYFKFDIYSSQKLLAHVYNTHFKHSKNDFHPTVKKMYQRKKQMESILNDIKRSFYDRECVIITGDLNMGMNEYLAQKQKHLKRNAPNLPTAATQFLHDSIWKKHAKTKECILDHTLLINAERFVSKILPTYDLKKPSDALSDHQAVFSVISLRQGLALDNPC